MNKCRDQALKTQLKAQLSGSSLRWKNFDPGSRFERPAGLMCSRRVHGLSSANIAQDAPQRFGRSQGRFGAHTDSWVGH